MDTTAVTLPAPRRRRRHTPEFKAQVIAACLQPGVSIAAVALANQLNANFLRSWVKAYRDQQQAGLPVERRSDRREALVGGPPPTLVAVKVQAADAPPLGDIQIEIRHRQTVFQIAWPAAQATTCAQWLSEVLR
jgi:transposase-like protein